MALNGGAGMPIGFTWFSKDGGLMKSMKEITGEFDQIQKALNSLGKEATAQGAWGRFMADVEKKRERIEDLSHSIRSNFVDHNLTTGFEKQLTDTAKAAREIAVNYGMVDERMPKFISKVTGMTISLNIGAQEAAAAVRGWQVATKELGAIGLKSASDLAKLAQATGTNADLWRATTKQMRGELGFTDEAIRKTMGSFTKFGMESGSLTHTLESVPDMLKHLRNQAALSGKALSDMDLAKFSAQTAAMARGLFAVTGNSEESMQMAQQMADTLISARKNLGNMFAGTEDELSAFATDLGVSIGDIHQSFALMNSGPSGFIQQMTDMVAAAKRNGRDTAETMNMLRARLDSAVGPEQAALFMNFFQRADENVAKAMKDVEGAGADFQKIIKKGFTTGRTLHDEMELAENLFVTGFRRIGRVEARKFVSDTSAQFRSLGKTLQDVASEGGALGFLVKKFSEIHQLGTYALLPDTLRPLVAVFNSIGKEALPVITALGALGFRFKYLVNPIGLVVTGFAAMAFILRGVKKEANATLNALSSDKGYKKGQQALASLNKELQKQKEGSEGYLKIQKRIAQQERALSTVKNIRLEQAALDQLQKERKKDGLSRQAILALDVQIASRQKNIATLREGFLKEANKRGLQQMRDFVRSAAEKVIEFAGMLPDVIEEVIDAIGNVLPALGPPLWKALTQLGAWIWQAVKNWWHGIVDIWSKEGTGFFTRIKETFKSSVGMILGVLALGAFTPVLGVLGGVIAMLFSIPGAIAIAAAAIWYFWDDIVNMLIDAKDYFVDVWDKIKNYVIGKAQAMVAWFKENFPNVQKIVEIVIAGLKLLWEGYWSYLGLMWKMISKMIGFWMSVIKGAILVAVGVIRFVWNSFGDFLSGLWKRIVVGAESVWGTIREIIASPIEWLKKKWDEFLTFFDEMWKSIDEKAKKTSAYLSKLFSRSTTVSTSTTSPPTPGSAPGTVPVPAGKTPLGMTEAAGAYLDAINFPGWYKDFKPLFAGMMNEIQVMMKQQGEGSRGGKRGQTRRSVSPLPDELGLGSMTSTGTDGRSR